MGQAKDIVPVSALTGRSVLSLSTGNKLGAVRDIFVDPLSGLVVGLTLSSADGSDSLLPYDRIHSFGHDAIMAISDEAVESFEETPAWDKPLARELIGTRIITDSGNLLGQIADILVTISPPPAVVYEIRESLLDRLLGKQVFVPASAGYALSDDRQRLIVPNETADLAVSSIDDLTVGMSVRSIYPGRPGERGEYDDTVIVPVWDEDETVVRELNEDETVVRSRDGDDTVLRKPPPTRA